MAISMLAHTTIMRWSSSVLPVSDEEFSSHMRMLDLALEIDPRNYFGFSVKAFSQNLIGAYKESVRTADMALRIFPDHAPALAIKAFSNFNITGNTDFVLEFKKWQGKWNSILLLVAFFSADMKDEALEQSESLFEELVELAYSDLCASAVICYYLEDPQNHPKIKRFLSNHPNLKIQNCRRPVFGNPKSAERFEVGMRKLFALKA